jgi:penicillin-binding protein 3
VTLKKLMIVLIGTLFIIILAGCQEKPQPDDRLQEYIKLWNKKQFDQMYDGFLSQNTKEDFSTDDFVKRYNDLYKDLEVKSLKVSFQKPKDDQKWEDKEEAQFPVEVSMETLAGKVKYEEEVILRKEEKEDNTNWYIDWNPSLILPNMEQGDKVRIETVQAQRGEILDRNEKSLAVNGEAYEIGIVPVDFKEENLEKVASLLEVSPEFITEEMNQSWVKPGYFVPLKKMALTEKETAVKVTSIPGILSKRVEAREYPYGESMAHLIGYIGKITAEEYEKKKADGYKKQDLVGKRGAEELFEKRLKGTDGNKIYLEKENGETVDVVQREVKNGETIQLTVDAKLQKAIYEQMKTEAGTAASINPQTGEVLALISTPSFDPNQFVLGISNSEYKKLEDNPLNPLLNRFSATYSPGSTMKPITASAGFMADTLDPNKVFEIKGKQWQKDDSWGDYQVTRVFDNDTTVDLESGLKFSDNIYFARIGLEMGEENFVNGLKKFGFGEELPFAYPIKSSQISNDGEIKKEIQLADSAFGQGEILMSILHLASSYGGIINDGNMMKPLLLKDEKQETWKEGLITKEQSALLKENLRKVVSEGIAQKANVKGKEIAGKTGTAEIKTEQGEKGKENGLFVSYDQNDPSMLMTMLLENVENKGGSTHTVEVSQDFYESLGD